MLTRRLITPAALLLSLLFTAVAQAGLTLVAHDPATEWLADSLQVDRLMANGSKAEALAGGNALYEKTVNRLNEARIRAADLSLRRINPFINVEARQVANTEFAAERKVIDRLTANYAALIQIRPGFLTKLSEPVPDEIKHAADAYQGVLMLRAAINVARIADATLGRPESDPPRLTQSAFLALLEAQLRGSADESSKNIQAVIAGSRPSLLTPSTASADFVATTVGLVPAFLTSTRDHSTAEQVLTAALALDATNSLLWCQRVQVRIQSGDVRNALGDLLVAKALAPDSPDFTATNRLYNETPKFADHVYQEPYNHVMLASASLSALLGGPLLPEQERAAAAARRNAGRCLYACSFIDDGERLKVAVKWALENHKAGLEVATIASTADATLFDTQFSAAKEPASVLASFDDHAALLGPEIIFWKLRTQALFKLGQPRLAAFSFTVAALLKPDADWLPQYRAAISKALDKNATSSSP